MNNVALQINNKRNILYIICCFIILAIIYIATQYYIFLHKSKSDNLSVYLAYLSNQQLIYFDKNGHYFDSFKQISLNKVIYDLGRNPTITLYLSPLDIYSPNNEPISYSIINEKVNNSAFVPTISADSFNICASEKGNYIRYRCLYRDKNGKVEISPELIIK